MPSSQIFYEPFIYLNWQLPTQLFTLIDTILAYNKDSEAPWLPTEVATSLAPIDELMSVPLPPPIQYPPGFFINLVREDSLASDASDRYQVDQALA